MKSFFHSSLLGIASVVVLAGCASPAGMAGMSPGSPMSSSGSPVATSSTCQNQLATSEQFSSMDKMFARMMIPHHEQAVEMSEIMLTKAGVDPDITDLAIRIKEGQSTEINTMSGWLNTDARTTDGMGDMDSMGGMASDEQMTAYREADGVEAERLFLMSMTEHHQGGIHMAQREVELGGNAAAVDLAQTMVEVQRAEIQEMDDMLADL